MDQKYLVSLFCDGEKVDIEVVASTKQEAIESIIGTAKSIGGWIAKEEGSSLTYIKLESVSKIISVDIAAQDKENEEMWEQSAAFFDGLNR
ncbi:hypothetical protein ACQKOF_19910 [Lysinibacillus sp. NPDC093190]|uniref:hypothetical protein n=1 Tax=Lysinibacillus sp. NPDC093190 TaxID=3390575 RepID=UPI003D07BD3B